MIVSEGTMHGCSHEVIKSQAWLKHMEETKCFETSIKVIYWICLGQAVVQPVKIGVGYTFTGLKGEHPPPPAINDLMNVNFEEQQINHFGNAHESLVPAFGTLML